MIIPASGVRGRMGRRGEGSPAGEERGGPFGSIPPGAVQWGITLGQSFHQYDLEGAGLPADLRGLDDAYKTSAGLLWRRGLENGWFQMAMLGAGLSFADGADLENAATYGAMLGYGKRVSERLTLGAGVRVETRLWDDGVRVMPMPIIDLRWRINDRLSLSLRRDLTLTYALDDERRWKASLSASFSSREFRLPEGIPASNGTVRDEAAPVLLGLEYRPSRLAFVRLSGGANVWRRVRLMNEDGGEIYDQKASSAGAVARLAVGLGF